jgi:diaminopropionate ammonia-lyase
MDSATIFHNPVDIGSLAWNIPSKNPLAFHRRLPGYAPTPLLHLERLAHRLGVADIYLKDESSRLGLPSFKILGAAWAVYRALSERIDIDLDRWKTLEDLYSLIQPLGAIQLVSATDGNHGRAVARMASLLRLGAKIFVPKGTAVSRIHAIESEGAQVIEVGESYEEAVDQAAREQENGALLIQDTAWPGYEQVPRWIVEGYSTLFWEIDETLTRERLLGPDLVLLQIGVGAFAAAGVAHFRRPEIISSKIFGVEPMGAACALASLKSGNPVTVPGPHTSIMAGLNCGRVSFIAWPLLLAGLDGVIAIEDTRAVEAVRELAADEVISGESGAAGLAGLLEIVSNSTDNFAKVRSYLTSTTRVLLVSTEGATDPQSYSRILHDRPA